MVLILWFTVHNKSPIRRSENSCYYLRCLHGFFPATIQSPTIAYSSVYPVHNISVEILERDLDDHVRQFWNLETIGIKTTQDKGMTTRSFEILSGFHNSFYKVDDSRVLKLSWKPVVILLSNNYEIVLK
ncbi:hypothetical protein TNCT_232031 [Trichonephila clavata]|uniref:Uncharacterized protein n=1 Tax=Trichonephila clavata TaxID=2740835 RepID=A0A8X6HGY3_TRICU|nr:hypothetical protein TNCT_232031 [Trichonephila clavata]